MKFWEKRLKAKRESYWFKKVMYMKGKLEDAKEIRNNIPMGTSEEKNLEEYKRGLANGMELAIATLEDRNPDLILTIKK